MSIFRFLFYCTRDKHRWRMNEEWLKYKTNVYHLNCVDCWCTMIFPKSVAWGLEWDELV